MRVLLTLLYCGLFSIGAAMAEAPRLTLVELATSDRAAQPSVAVDPREGFVLTWQTREEAGAVLHFAVLDEGGRILRRGEIARGDNWFINGADFPQLAVLDNGDWVSFWLQKTAADPYAYAIRLVRSRDRGAHWDAPLTVHDDGTATEHGFVSLLADGDDRVRAFWLDGRHMAAAQAGHAGHDASERMTLRSAHFGRDGKQGEETEIDALTCACCQTDAVRIGERQIVVYRDRTVDEIRDIYRVEHGRAGWQAPRPLHADGWRINACPVNGPALAVRDGRVAALWPTMASGEMRVQLLADIDADANVQVIAAGGGELGRVDLAGWHGGWLVTRVVLRDQVPHLVLSELDADGRTRSSQDVAARVGGYPRLAVHGEQALLAWTQAGDASGTHQVRAALLRPSASPSD